MATATPRKRTTTTTTERATTYVSRQRRSRTAAGGQNSTPSYIPLFSKYDSCLRWSRRQPQVNRRSRRTNGENLHCLEHAYHLARWMKRGQPESQVVVAVGLGTDPGAGWGSRRRATTKASSSRRLRPTQASKT